MGLLDYPPSWISLSAALLASLCETLGKLLNQVQSTEGRQSGSDSKSRAPSCAAVWFSSILPKICGVRPISPASANNTDRPEVSRLKSDRTACLHNHRGLQPLSKILCAVSYPLCLSPRRCGISRFAQRRGVAELLLQLSHLTLLKHLSEALNGIPRAAACARAASRSRKSRAMTRQAASC